MGCGDSRQRFRSYSHLKLLKIEPGIDSKRHGTTCGKRNLLSPHRASKADVDKETESMKDFEVYHTQEQTDDAIGRSSVGRLMMKLGVKLVAQCY